MSESADSEGLRGRISSRGEEALGDVAQLLLENPLFSQVLQVALETREKASVAGAHAMRNLNLPTAGDVERLERRLRLLSDRLEAVEDVLDGLAREVSALGDSRRAVSED